MSQPFRVPPPPAHHGGIEWFSRSHCGNRSHCDALLGEQPTKTTVVVDHHGCRHSLSVKASDVLDDTPFTLVKKKHFHHPKKHATRNVAPKDRRIGRSLVVRNLNLNRVTPSKDLTNRQDRNAIIRSSSHHGSRMNHLNGNVTKRDSREPRALVQAASNRNEPLVPSNAPPKLDTDGGRITSKSANSRVVFVSRRLLVNEPRKTAATRSLNVGGLRNGTTNVEKGATFRVRDFGSARNVVQPNQSSTKDDVECLSNKRTDFLGRQTHRLIGVAAAHQDMSALDTPQEQQEPTRENERHHKRRQQRIAACQ